MKKFAEKIVGVLTVLLLSPVIIIGLLCVAFCMFWDWLKEPSRKREYECSSYYKDFQIPYHINITKEEIYRFYNEAKDRKLSVKMIHGDLSYDY